MKKNKCLFLGMVVFLLMIYCLIVLLLPLPHINSFWCSFFLSSIGYLIACGFVYITFLKEKKDGILYNYAVLRASLIYVFAEAIFNIFEMASGIIPIQILVIVNIIIIVIYVISFVAINKARDVNDEFDAKLSKEMFDYKRYSIKLMELGSRVNNNELKSKIKKIEELVKYADPVSPQQIIEIEKKISEKMSNLEDLVVNQKDNDALDCCNEILELINARNKECKLYK